MECRLKSMARGKARQAHSAIQLKPVGGRQSREQSCSVVGKDSHSREGFRLAVGHCMRISSNTRTRARGAVKAATHARTRNGVQGAREAQGQHGGDRQGGDDRPACRPPHLDCGSGTQGIVWAGWVQAEVGAGHPAQLCLPVQI